MIFLKNSYICEIVKLLILMDIDLLSKMVKELILDNDKVVLPGLGAFVAEIVPATFSDKGFTINPPYRKLYFRAKPDEGSALAEFYASSNKVNMDIAEKVIGGFVAELKSVLFTRKTVVFPGLGRLRATKENAVFFVADEDLDIYPEGFALEPISLKTHVETPAEVAAVVGSLKAIVDDVAPVVEVQEEPEIEDTVVEEKINEPEVVVDVEEVEESEPVEDEPVEEPVEDEPVVEPVEEQAEEVVQQAEEVAEEAPVVVKEAKTSFWKIFAKTLMWLVTIAVVLLAAYIIVARFAPDMLDKVLYTPEELEIINR